MYFLTGVEDFVEGTEDYCCYSWSHKLKILLKCINEWVIETNGEHIIVLLINSIVKGCLTLLVKYVEIEDFLVVFFINLNTVFQCLILPLPYGNM